MLPTGSFLAPSTCLRCQLRRVIFRTHIRCVVPCIKRPLLAQTGAFHASAARYQEFDEVLQVDDKNRQDERPTLSEYPMGRIIGKPGRRQRESYARLKTDAMDKPFEVVVMTDVPEARQETPSSATEVHSRSDRSEISSSGILVGDEPSLEEVNESIDSLRPAAQILEEEQYGHLVKELMEGYNTQQLSSYMVQALRLDNINADKVQLINEDPLSQNGPLKRTAWRLGKTPLEQRRRVAGVIKKSELGTNKTKLANQIMRLAWSLTVHSEVQQVGELEVSLKPWQLRYLFDLSPGGLPMYHTMIPSTLLQRNSEIRPYRPANIMRITARRQDAEEIADELELQLQRAARVEVSLGVFRKALGRPGWPKFMSELFDESAVKQVEQATTTVIDRRDFKVIVIYGRSSANAQHARRLLLSFLDMPSPRRIEITDVLATSKDLQRTAPISTQLLLPDHASSNVHLWKQSHKLGRLTMPSPRVIAPTSVSLPTVSTQNNSQLELPDQKAANASRNFLARSLIERLSTIKPLHLAERSSTVDPDSYWMSSKSVQYQRWSAQLCEILHPAASGLDMTNFDQTNSRRKKTKAPNTSSLMDGSKRSVVQTQVPGIATLLSYFLPKDIEPTRPFLVAHFMPSPFTARGFKAMENLPRIEMVYYFSKDMDGQLHTNFHNIRAILAAQQLRVPLPHETVDLQLERTTVLSGAKAEAFHNPEIEKFTQTLERSAREGHEALSGEPMVSIRLPAWLAENRVKSGTKRDVEVDYLFERFEEVQVADFLPLKNVRVPGAVDADMSKILAGIPEDMVLSYRDVEGGFVGGRKSELSLRYLRPSKFKRMRRREAEEDAMAYSSADKGSFEDEINTVTEENSAWPLQRPGEARQHDLKLVETGLGLAHALTRISAGKLKPLYNTEE